MNVSGLLRDTARRFARASLHYGHGARTAREEAAWLISSVLGYLLEEEVTPQARRKIEGLVRRRIRQRVPVAYLLKEAWLGEHSFYIDRRAIVPRSYIAELLRERFSPWLTRDPRRTLDLCTGSGCLAVLLALTFENSRADAADLSLKALEVARINIKRYRLGKRVRAIRSDLFLALGKTKYDLIVSNPPYVTTRSMRKLPKEYRHEPAFGLAAGKDGLDLVRKILAQAKDHLAPGGLLVCEIGGNRKALERAYPKIEFAWPETSDPGSVFILQREQLPA
ncbi:MAG TPA: 50S ribosomal protein L3 N(5)-glutamine methyltransferase [Candidatus Eremiobacteraceae bacterium]|nr:50S ribosomal protein L3 N(5)-glutamine methyltransferase [Candidatus Eremiobacteraceae bacterium]